MASVVVAIALLASLVVPGVAPTPTPTRPAAVTAARQPLLDAERLRTNALLARAGVDPWASQSVELLKQAERALACAATGGGAGLDSFGAAVRALEAASSCAYTLAVAATVGDDPRYVRRATELAIAWTDADPCQLWGRGCDGVRPTPAARSGDIVRLDRAASELALAADLTRRRGGLAGAEGDRMAAWLARLLPDGPPPLGPEGDLQVALRMAIGAIAGDADVRDAATAEWRQRLSLILPDGRVSDGSAAGVLGLDRTQEALGHRLLAVTVAGPAGRDLLAATGPGGVRVEDSVNALAAGMVAPSTWDEDEAPAPDALWELAYSQWGASTHRPLVAAFRERPSEGEPPYRWSSLVFGLADPRIGSQTPTPRTSPPPTPTPFSTPLPAVGVPRVTLRRGSVRDGTIAADIRWDPATALPEGRIEYRVHLRQDAGTWRQIGETDGTSIVARLPVGPQVEVRVRASSERGPSTSWVNGEPFALRWLEESVAEVSPLGAWRPASNPGYSRGTLVYAERPGATITFTVDGSGVALRAPTGPTRGEARVRIDDGPVTVIDEYATHFSPAVILFVASWDEPGRHVLSIEVVGTRGRETVSIDALAVLP